MSRKREVRFSSIEFIYFPLKLGDNPGVSSGAPLTLGWKSIGRSTTDVDSHEDARPLRKSGDRGLAHRIPAVDREVHLLALGYKMHQILLASEKTDQARKDRLRSFQSRRWDRFAGVVQSAKKGFSKTLARSNEAKTMSAVSA